MGPTIVFASTCPHCDREQLHTDFTVADLQRLLDGGYPIEAHCAHSDRFWSISVQERVRLGGLVAASHPGKVPREGT